MMRLSRCTTALTRSWALLFLLVFQSFGCLQAQVLDLQSAMESTNTVVISAETPTLPSLPTVSSPRIESTGTVSNQPVRSPAVRNTTGIIITGNETSSALRTFLGLTAIAFLPMLLVCTTAFLRIIVVMAILRNAIGMQDTPPTTVLIALSLFLTLFVMSDVVWYIQKESIQPFLDGQISIQAAYDKGIQPLREFMIRQTREQDVALMIELSKAAAPKSVEEIATTQLIPAFIISELRTAFQIGFVIFLPFLLIDLIVSSLLMAMGMMMMPPVTVSLPIKLMMFVLIDGWGLVVGSLVRTFN